MSHYAFRSMLDCALPFFKVHRINEVLAPTAPTIQNEVLAPTAPTIQQDVIDQVAQRFIASLTPEALKAFNGRLERGLEMAKNGSVQHLANSVRPRRFLVLSSEGKQKYVCDLDTRTCDCPDSLKGNTCKHRIAAYYVEQAEKINAIQSVPAPIPIKVEPELVIPSPKPVSREDQILAELGFGSDTQNHKDDQPAGFKLGMLYRRYLHGSDLAQQSFKVTILDITKETVMPHPSMAPVGKWCLWVDGLPEGLPNGILFGATGERDLIAIFGPICIDQLKGKSITIYPKSMSVAGQTKIAIRFRSAQ